MGVAGVGPVPTLGDVSRTAEDHRWCFARSETGAVPPDRDPVDEGAGHAFEFCARWKDGEFGAERRREGIVRFSAGPLWKAQVSDMCGHERVRTLTFREILVATGMLQGFARLGVRQFRNDWQTAQHFTRPDFRPRGCAQSRRSMSTLFPCAPAGLRGLQSPAEVRDARQAACA